MYSVRISWINKVLWEAKIVYKMGLLNQPEHPEDLVRRLIMTLSPTNTLYLDAEVSPGGLAGRCSHC